MNDISKLGIYLPPPSATPSREPVAKAEDFRLQLPEVFPSMERLPNPEVASPKGLWGLLDVLPPRVLPLESAHGSIKTAADAEETAALTRDQIRWDPRMAIIAQAHSTPESVLTLLT